jgi:predicted ATPase
LALLPYLPILELLRTYFGITEGDGEREARQKIAEALLLLDRDLEPALPMFFDFLGVPDPDRPVQAPGPAMQRRLFGAVRRVVEAEARREPSVVLVEDLHWIDDASAEFLVHLIDGALAAHGLMLLNFRPEFRAAWMERTGYRQIPLLPFDRDAVDALLANLLGHHPSVAGLGALLHERTGGTPFFLEEVVRELAETGALEGEPGNYRLTTPLVDVHVPATVQAVLAARIDRLAVSPVYWLTVPSKRCTPSVRIWKKRSRISCHPSGPTSSARSIEPFTSAKSTVTCFRSPSSALREVRIFSARCFGV